MRQEVEMCKEEAAAAAERGVQEAELRMSAESQVELLQVCDRPTAPLIGAEPVIREVGRG